MLQGRLIVFEGPDNCGKSTQFCKLSSYLKEENKSHTLYKFPRYDRLYGEIIRNMLYNKKDFDILHNISDMNKFSYFQLQDKLDAIRDIHESLKTNDYVILDRYTLSSRIYDAASRFCLKNNIEPSDFFEENEKTLRTFLNEWIFSSDYREPYHKSVFEDAYSILENPVFDTYHVLFKTCPEIENITKMRRSLDAYEEESTLKNLVSWAYDNITNVYRLENKHHFFKKDKYITVDSTALMNNLDKDQPSSDDCREVIHNYIVSELFNKLESF
jgi:hypothetical protein